MTHYWSIIITIIVLIQLSSAIKNEIKKLGLTDIKTSNKTNDLRETELNMLPQCCPKDHIVKDDPSKGIICVPVSFLKTVYDKENNKTFRESDQNSNREWNGIPSCSSGRPRILHNRDGIWFKLFSQTNQVKVGLDYFIWAAWIPVQQHSFCLGLDYISIITEIGNSTIDWNTDVDYSILIFCKLDDLILKEFTIHRYIYGLSSLSTCIPILVTLALFVHLKIHHNPRKWVLMSYFFSYCCSCTVHGLQILIYLNNLEHEPTLWCRIYSHLFLYFGCVFGTACMFVSLEIFYCFWCMNSQLSNAKAPKSRSVTMILITWLGPLVLYVTGELWREYYANRPPDLAWQKCTSLNFDAIEFLIMIQFVFKFGVYLSTSLLIYKHKKSTSFATINAQDFKESKTLYAKLFVTTGMPFTCLALDYCFAYENPMALYWFLLRFPHGFIGVYNFIVFGLSKEVRKKWRLTHLNSQDKANNDTIKRSNISDRSDVSGNCQFSSKFNRSQSSLLSVQPSFETFQGGRSKVIST